MVLDTRSSLNVIFGLITNLVFLLTQSCSSNPEKFLDHYPVSSEPIDNQVEWQKKLYFKRISDFENNPIGFNKIIFLGNSITEGGGDWNQRFKTKNIINRGISGDFTSGILARLDEIVYYKPKAVFLLVGLNDIFGINDSKISANYVFEQINKIASEINIKSPKTELYIQTILPVDEKKYLKVKGFYPSHKEPLPEKILDINNKITDKSEKNYHVIDLYKSFIDDNGGPKGFLFEDGVHLNAEGYELWTSILEEYIYKFEKINQ